MGFPTLLAFNCIYYIIHSNKITQKDRNFLKSICYTNSGDDDMTNKNNYTKTASIGIIAILTYFILPNLEALPFALLGLDTATLPLVGKIIYMIAFEVFLMCLILFIFYPKLQKDWQDIKKNHMNYFSKYLKYWLVGLIIMMISNLCISIFSSNEIAANEQVIQDLFVISPIYVFFSTVIFAPIVEELVFRQGIRNIVTNDTLFILLSGLIFGGLHVISSDMGSLSELFYLIPYCTPGFIFAYILAKTDNIFVSMGLHFMHNGILISLQFFLLLFS